jgi:CubicO group peptidase (beta-lactamase class C family)
MRAVRSEEAASALDGALKESSSGPGAIVGVVTSGGLLTTKSAGTTTIDSGEPLGERTAFYIASVSKQYTAACVLLAADDGRLSLGDRLTAFFPELPSWAHEVRIEHLLSHSAGLPDYGQLIEASGRSLLEQFGDDLILEALGASSGPAFKPGSEVSYSNTGYVLLGTIIQLATGLSLRNYASARVFGPLNMVDTRYRDDYRESIRRLAVGHVVRDGEVVRFESCFDRVGDGGVVSTLSDWAIWEATLLARLEPWYSLDERLAAPFTLDDGSVSSWRAGVVVEQIAGETAILTGGTGLGYRAFSARLPIAGFSVCCLSNIETSDVKGLSLRIVEAINGGL